MLSVYGVGSFRNVGEFKTNIWRRGSPWRGRRKDRLKRAKSERLVYMGLKMKEERVLGVESRGEDRELGKLVRRSEKVCGKG